MSEPSRAELGPILASYGNAVLTCGLLESGLRLLLAVASDTRKRQNVPDVLEQRVHEKAKMLGDLFPIAMQYEAFSDAERKQIWDAIRLRNLLVHNYWTPKALQGFLTPAGREWLVSDLESKRDQIREADRVITRYVDAYLVEHGLTVESIAMPMFAEYEPNPGPPDSVLH